MVVRSDGDPALERLYSRASGLPRRRLPRYHGTAVSWQNSERPDDSAFVVELPGGPLAARARAATPALCSRSPARSPPRVVSKPIPYGPERRADMAAYARRHYGIDDHRLTRPA